MALPLKAKGRFFFRLGKHLARASLRIPLHSLAMKILLLTIGGQMVLFAVLALHNANLIEESLTEPFKLRVESLKPLFNLALAPLLVKGDYAALAERLEDTRSDEDIQYLVLRNADDRIVASAGWNPQLPLPLASRQVLEKDEIYDSFLLIEVNGKKYGTLNFGLSTRKLASYRDELRLRGLAIIVAGMLLIGAIQLWFAVKLTRRLLEVSTASEEVAQGRFELHLDDSGRDEVARLASSMNAMSRAIRDKISRLEHSEERLRLAMDAGSVVPWERGLADNSFLWGPGVERLLGPMPKRQSAYPDLLSMVHPQDRDQYLSAREETLNNPAARDCDFRIRRTDGAERWLAVRGKFVRRTGSEAGFVMGVARDITAAKRAELEILRLNQELELRVEERTGELQAANRELEAFSYTISHDLRAPLRAISGFTAMLREECSAHAIPDPIEISLGRIETSASRMSVMLDDLLLFSKASRSPLQRSTVMPGHLVAELMQELQFPEARRAHVRILPMPACEADPTLLRQVYANLISNALKYSGKVDQPVVEIGAKPDKDGGTAYFVQDNGAGFDMDQAHKLFGVFQRLHSGKEFDGTGVGLAIAHRIISRHGGRIWAHAAPGEGATFLFSIPAK